MADRSSLALTLCQPPPARAQRRSLDGWATPPADPALEFVSTVAHELRQSLTVLSASVDILQRAPSSEVAGAATSTIRRKIDEMSRVVDDLTDATRWAYGKVTLLKRCVDARDVLADAAADAAAPAAARGHELEVSTASRPLWVDADPQRLQQMLSNLLTNAIKFTDQPGRISVAGEARAGTVFLRVSDTGRGIAREALPHVFDLFSQFAHPEDAGLGIGLSVVREIVSLHGGQVEARSEGSGRGSEFIVTLPFAAPPPATPIFGSA
jgi:signal transduction histidine kinase